MTLDQLSAQPRVTVRWPGAPDPDGQVVVYWMQRAQRAWDNPALDLAVTLGNLLRKPVVVFFGLHPFVAGATHRQYQFLVEGLGDIADGLAQRRVGFEFRCVPRHRLLPYLDEVRPAMVIGDENPLRQAEGWRETVATRVRVPFWTVDADVVVPSSLITSEQYAARTMRPRLHRHLDEFLVGDERPAAAIGWPAGRVPLDTTDVLEAVPDRRATPVGSFRGGTTEARRHLQAFVSQALDGYDTARNHPELDGTSRLSPYLRFGHIGPREVALAVRNAGGSPASTAAFLEQLIVRRELAVNFVRYNGSYDSLAGCEGWARVVLRRHQRDPRPHLYSRDRFEQAGTHDPLWNAAQRQLVTTGWMHNYVRMYWAKKMLEWSATPEEAFDTAVILNDRYALDGRDPNGYAGIAWAIGGKHDRPWPTRPVYGTIRSMSFASTSRKFDARRFIGRWSPAPGLF